MIEDHEVCQKTIFSIETRKALAQNADALFREPPTTQVEAGATSGA